MLWVLNPKRGWHHCQAGTSTQGCLWHHPECPGHPAAPGRWCWGSNHSWSGDGISPGVEGWFSFSWSLMKAEREICLAVDETCCGWKDEVSKVQCLRVLRLVCSAWFNSKRLSKVRCSWEEWQWQSCGIALWFSFMLSFFSLTFCNCSFRVETCDHLTTDISGKCEWNQI